MTITRQDQRHSKWFILTKKTTNQKIKKTKKIKKKEKKNKKTKKRPLVKESGYTKGVSYYINRGIIVGVISVFH